jgi:simple sugar transport system permease protein
MISASIVGALFVQCLTTTVYALGVPPEAISLLKAIVILVLCLFQSDSFRQRVSKRIGRMMKGADAA